MTEEEEQYDYDKKVAEFREKNKLILKIVDELIPRLENPDITDYKQYRIDKETFISLLNHFMELNLPMPDILATHISKSIKDGTITYGNTKYEVIE